MDKSEKERRKNIKKDLRLLERKEFESSLPLEIVVFESLFDFLDSEFQNVSCDDTMKLSKRFLEQNKIKNITNVFDWLAEKGAYCDCEILANVEEKFEN